MGSVFYNRLSGIRTNPGDSPLLGLWSLCPGAENLRLNSAQVKPGDYLVPDTAGRWTLTLEGNPEISLGRLGASTSIEALDKDTRAIGRRLKEVACWPEWLEVPPVSPELGDKKELELGPLEKAIRKWLPYLREVCYKPSTHLKVEIDLVSVSRARRTATQALNYLAAHTEDWDKLIVGGVLPRRVLAELREDDLNIYENRVTVRLIDHLKLHLIKRKVALRKIRHALEEYSNYSRALGGLFTRNSRICELWGESVDAAQGRRMVDETLKEIENLVHQLNGLMDTPLYKEIPTTAAVPDTLQMTNIFANHPAYRYVALLWGEWVNQARSRTMTSQQIYEDRQALCRSFERFCTLLVVRALDQLGMQISPHDLKTPLVPGAELRLVAQGGAIFSLRWDLSSVLSLSSRLTSVRILPLPASLITESIEDKIEAHWDQLVQSFQERNSSIPTLVLHLSDPLAQVSSDDARVGRLWTVGNEREYNVPEGLGFVPVSPWEIDSVERLARGIRWVFLKDDLLAYPHTLKTPVPDGVAVGPWILAGGDKGHARITRLPTNDETKPLKERHDRTEFKLQRLESSLVDLSNSLKKYRPKRQEYQHLHSEKANLEREKEICQRELGRLSSFTSEIDALRSASFADVGQCPICSSRATRSQVGGMGYYRYSCHNCGAAWGVRICGSCKQRFPFLDPCQVSLPDRRPAGWIDRTFGRDILAIPIGIGPEITGFSCPGCGNSS
jgi:hypothetical protein